MGSGRWPGGCGWRILEFYTRRFCFRSLPTRNPNWMLAKMPMRKLSTLYLFGTLSERSEPKARFALGGWFPSWLAGFLACGAGWLVLRSQGPPPAASQKAKRPCDQPFAQPLKSRLAEHPCYDTQPTRSQNRLRSQGPSPAASQKAKRPCDQPFAQHSH